MADMKELCGAWKKQGRNTSYYSGQVKEDITIPAGSYVSIFQNRDATDDNRKPQLRVLFSEPEGQASRPAPRQQRSTADALEDEIPF